MTHTAITAQNRNATGLPAATALGPVELTVGELDRAIGFYAEVVGLQVHDRNGSVAALGSGAGDLLILHEDRAAKPQGRHAGLYHVALLYRSREELARAAQRILISRVPIQGASDHGTHEAIYLPDADRIGLELAWDRPREEWPDIRDINAWPAGPQPLDLDGLLALVQDHDPVARAAPGLKIGHVHFHVGDIGAARSFYVNAVGFEEQVFLGTAGFVSAGGYHHHVAFNTWRGPAVPPVPEGVVGMRHFTIELPQERDVVETRARISAAGHTVDDRGDGFMSHDPSGNALLVRAGGTSPRAGRPAASSLFRSDRETARTSAAG